MFIFSKAFPLMKKGYRIRHKRWPELYFITLEENKVHDSSGNLYLEDFEDYLVKNSDVQSLPSIDFQSYHVLYFLQV